MIHQLRIYEIFEHNKAAFHERFRDHATRIMRTYGFDIIATWETRTEDRIEFVYLLAWPDEATMSSAWARFRLARSGANHWHTFAENTRYTLGENYWHIIRRKMTSRGWVIKNHV